MALRIGQPLDRKEKFSTIECFWRKNPPDLIKPRYEPYFEYYFTEVQALCIGLDEKDYIRERMAVETYEDVRFLVKQLADGQELDLSSAIQQAKTLFPKYQNDDEAIRLSIDFAMRVWLMLNTRDASVPVNVGNTPKIRWEFFHASLKEFVALQFALPDPMSCIPLSESLLDSNFTAYTLHHLYKIDIAWTNCLADHLRLDLTGNQQTLYIFPYRISLYDHDQNTGIAAGPIFPQELIRETIWSLNLLFPADDTATKKLLSRLGRDFHQDHPYTELRPLDLNHYRYWRARLSALRQLYVVQPKDLRAALRDSRSTLQLYTLWTALIVFLLTIVFGTISSATAIISTRANLRALDVANQALQLQITQGISTNDSSIQQQ